jgi:uncharacterized protein involved in copper resistance
MNREDIIRMAREAGWDAHHAEFDTRFQIFAVLVASAERKECEKIIWNADDWIGNDAKIWLVKSIQEERSQA